MTTNNEYERLIPRFGSLFLQTSDSFSSKGNASLPKTKEGYDDIATEFERKASSSCISSELLKLAHFVIFVMSLFFILFSSRQLSIVVEESGFVQIRYLITIFGS